jgi:DNA-binding MarR family transcriptional regulator
LACELIQNFAPLREWQLGRALDLQTTSLIDLVNKLREKGWVEDQIDEADRRQKLLRLTKQGKDFFAQVKRRSARRYWYVFHNIPKLAEMDELKQVLTLMNENATKAIRAGVFDELPSDEDFPPTNLMGLPSFVNAPAKTRGRKIPGRL